MPTTIGGGMVPGNGSKGSKGARKARKGRGMLANGRSAGPGDRFIVLSHRLLASPAFRALSGDAVKLLVGIWQLHNGSNNGTIGYGLGDAQAWLGCSRRRAVELMDELEAFRLIRCTRAAAQLGRQSRRWELTEEQTTGAGENPTPASHAARRMTDGEVAAASAKLKAAKQAAKGRQRTSQSPFVESNPRTPMGTAFVPPWEPQTVPNSDQQALRTPVGTANGESGPTLRTPIGTGHNLPGRGASPQRSAPASGVPTSQASGRAQPRQSALEPTHGSPVPPPPSPDPAKLGTLTNGQKRRGPVLAPDPVRSPEGPAGPRAEQGDAERVGQLSETALVMREVLAAGWTRREVADHLGVDAQLPGHWHRGSRNASADKLAALRALAHSPPPPEATGRTAAGRQARGAARTAAPTSEPAVSLGVLTNGQGRRGPRPKLGNCPELDALMTAGLTQKQVAVALGVFEGTPRLWASGRCHPPEARRQAMRQLLAQHQAATPRLPDGVVAFPGGRRRHAH